MVASPMVSWLKAMSIPEPLANRYAAEFQRCGYSQPSDLEELSAEELREKFDIEAGYATTISESFSTTESDMGSGAGAVAAKQGGARLGGLGGSMELMWVC